MGFFLFFFLRLHTYARGGTVSPSEAAVVDRVYVRRPTRYFRFWKLIRHSTHIFQRHATTSRSRRRYNFYRRRPRRRVLTKTSYSLIRLFVSWTDFTPLALILRPIIIYLVLKIMYLIPRRYFYTTFQCFKRLTTVYNRTILKRSWFI